jgi:hypothetical protein
MTVYGTGGGSSCPMSGEPNLSKVSHLTSTHCNHFASYSHVTAKDQTQPNPNIISPPESEPSDFLNTGMDSFEDMYWLWDFDVPELATFPIAPSTVSGVV